MRYKAIAAALLCVLTLPAQAQQNPAINIVTPPDYEIITEAYKAATKNITQEQKARLDFLAKEHVKTLEPDMAIFEKGAKVKPCLDAGLIQDSDVKKFFKFQDHQNFIQDRLRTHFKNTYLKSVDFIDRDLLYQNLMTEQLIQMQLVGGMVKQTQENMTPEQIQADCPKFKAFLSEYVIKNAL